ncbi:MAG: hypothetical protein WCH62_05645, partial [Candidatus Omnitrophota bacterium]
PILGIFEVSTFKSKIGQKRSTFNSKTTVSFNVPYTAEISKATFGITPSEYKELKGLKREILRDHMDDFELIFTMLGERSTTEIHRNEDSQGVTKLQDDAKVGGDIAGGARKQLEKKLGRSVVTSENYLHKTENKKIK